MPLTRRAEMLRQTAHQLFDILADIAERVLIALRRVAEHAPEDRGGGIGQAVFTQIHNGVELVQTERGERLGVIAGVKKDSLFLHHRAGPPGNPRGWPDSGTKGLEYIAAVSSSETLGHLAAGRISDANE